MAKKIPSEEPREQANLLHAGFEIGILLKGLHAVSEIVGGALLWFVSPQSLGRVIKILTQNELAEDPHDFLANIMIRASEHYSISTQHFGVFYLLSHGGIKVILVFLLWRKKIWAYPLAVAVLVFFIVYQTIRWTTTHSVFLTAFTVLDLIMIWLTIVEYRKLKSPPQSGGTGHTRSWPWNRRS
ncbi:MAG: DUF2127 domain-containing protein [Rectinemataceae bacterium]|jgi:uncharacterized membrane protein